MSKTSLHVVTCPKCGKPQRIERYDSINNYHSELFSKIVDKTIFDYQCESCKETVHEPYPLLFHWMGFQDIQIAYKFPKQAYSFARAFLSPSETENKLREMGILKNDIVETYDDEDEFVHKVASVLAFHGHSFADKKLPTINDLVSALKIMEEDCLADALNEAHEKRFVKMALEHGGKPVKVIPSSSTTVNIFDLDKPEITEELLNQKEQDLRALLEEANKHHMQGSLAAVEYLKRFDELPKLRDNPEWKERVQKLLQEFAEQVM